MAKKDNYAPHQDKSFNQAQGRRSGESGKPKQEETNREKNVKPKGGEEHSRIAKGKRG